MNTINIYEVVVAKLKSRIRPQRQISDETGIPYSSLTKIAQGVNQEPSVKTIQKLYDYFVSLESE